MKPKVILTALGLLVLFGGITAGVFLVQKNQDFREKAAPATTLSILPASQNAQPGDEINLSVFANTGTNSITGVDISLTFDPSIFEVVSMNKGPGIANLDQVISTRNKFDNVAGTVIFSAFTLSSANGVTGSSIDVLDLVVKVKPGTSGSHNFSFAQDTVVAGSGEGQNVLINSSSGVVVISSGGQQQSNQTQSPSPTATSTTAGIGGGSNPTATATAAATSSSNSTTAPTQTATATSSSQTDPTATPFPVPETGMSLPSLLAFGVGFLVIVASLLTLVAF